MLVAVLAFSVYAIDGRAHLLGQSGDTDSNQLLPIALLSGDGFAFDRFFGDREVPYAFRRANGHVLAQYPVVPGLLNTVTFAVAKTLGGSDMLRDRMSYLSLLTGSVLTAVSVGLVFLLLAGEGYNLVPSAVIAGVYAFGTSAFSVASRGIWQHGPAVMFITFVLLLIRSESPFRVFAAGLAAGLAVESRVPTLVLLLPLVVIPYKRGLRTFAVFLGGFGLPILLMRLYAWHYWGSPFVLAENMGSASHSFLGDSPLEGLAGVLLSPGRGLLIYSPFMGLAAIGFRNAFRERDLYRIAIGAGICLYVLTTAAWVSWWGGKSFGTRMLTEIFPGGVLLAAGVATALWQRSRLWRVPLVAAVAWSLVVNYAGARHYPQIQFVDEAHERASAWSPRENELVATLSALRARVVNRMGFDR